MLISRDWLSDFIATDIPDNEISDLLTDTGLEVENSHVVDAIKGGLRGVVVAEVLTVEQHPNADRLRCVTVNAGSNDSLAIVCGAPNVAVGQKVALATIGCTIFPDGSEDGMTIKKGKIRGEPSMGMLCSEDELGLGQADDGIMVLNQDAVIGQGLAEHLNLPADMVFNIGLTPNRMDAMGHEGVARDLAASLKHRNRQHEVKTLDLLDIGPLGKHMNILLEDEVACPRYYALQIDGVANLTSPEWLQRRLQAIGIKSMNILVDATNYSMHTLGHPLHAFDTQAMDGQLVVRRAKQQELLTTLDGIERKLHQEDLVIANSKQALALAGLYGGDKSGVKDSSTSIVIESAWFDPVVIRKAAKRHGLSTDASFRYERGVDPSKGLQALQLAWTLIKASCPEASIAGLSGKVIADKRFDPRQITIDIQAINRLIGHDIDHKDIQGILKSLDIDVLESKGHLWTISIPAYRWDVTREADVAEEILRIYGFNAIPFPKSMRAQMTQEAKVTSERIQHVASEFLVGRGFHEILTNSLTKVSWTNNHPSIDSDNVVHVLNPLSQDLGVMRPHMIMGGLEAISYNIKRRQQHVPLFEWGRIYQHSDKGYNEANQLAIWLCGNHPGPHWSMTNQPSPFASLKGVTEGLLSRVGIEHKQQDLSGSEGLLSHGITYVSKGQILVELGWASPHAMQAADVDQEVVVAICHWDAIQALAVKQKPTYQAVPKHPSLTRDLALVVDESLSFGDIQQAVNSTSITQLKATDLFDVYQGENLPKGKLSYGIRMTFQDVNKTMKDKQVDGMMKRITDAILSQCDANIRQ